MNRLSLVRSFLAEHAAEWLLITDSIEARYMTGLNSSNITLAISANEAHLFTDFRYRQMAVDFCADNGWQFHELKQSYTEDLASLIGNGSVAIQSNYLSVDSFESLCKTMKNNAFLRLGKEISSLFSVKSDSEIESIQAAAAIADTSLSQWISHIREGISEREAADLLEQICRENGSREPSFETIVLFGARAALPHGRPSTESLLQQGDTILVDFGCTVSGFCSDMTRTFFYGTPADVVLERYEITLEAQKAGVAAVRPGISAAEVDAIVRDIIVESGYGEQFGHGTGHGVGLRIHELPALNSRDTTILQPGMVVTVEPGIYVEGESGVRIEDLLVVTDTGARALSRSPKELRIIS